MTDLISSDWQELDANNTNPSPNGVQGGYSPSQVAPILRTIRGAMKRSYVQQNPVYTTSGTGNAFIVTYEQAPQGYSKGIIYSFFTDRANTGPATLNINSLGTRNIVHRDGSALTANQIKAGGVLLVVFDGTNFVLLSAVNHDLKLTGAFAVDGSTVWHAGNDGAGSTLDADLLDGQHGSFYQDASNINAGTLSDLRLPATMSGKTFTGGITLNGTSGETSLTMNGPSHTTIAHNLNGILRGKSVYNATNQTIGWELFNSSGAGVRALTFRESDGLLSLQGTISSTGAITAGGNLKAGGDSGAVYGADGNITGTMWGGALTTWLANNKVSKGGDTMRGALTIEANIEFIRGGTKRYIHYDGPNGNIGFLTTAGGWSFRVDNGNTVYGGNGWTLGTDGNLYMPWAGKYLSTAIYDTANERGLAWRNDALANVSNTVGAFPVGGVGSTVFAQYIPGGSVGAGAYVDGVNLRTAGSSTGGSSSVGGTVLGGTWMCTGMINGSIVFTTFRRVG
ncbi:hypothetical protein [Endobacterium cereale]|uniref:hypothetical protein n=1 Tax=Endobacterium cereale TaxID=2663029 RepID=UPI002B49B0E4|nr:hypothetical protein [Endobacterium cereale]MEB2843814.1 hypothetical protein [Endobacterium cereale]